MRPTPPKRISALPLLLLAILVAFLALGCNPTTPRRDGSVDDAGDGTDTDGDTINDNDEGAAAGVDTDGDGTPDYQDSDSDDDGIADSVEAGDADVATPPIDSDGDGVPDFRDTDSDGNAILDAEELEGDIDGDGRPNFADIDDDGDTMSDVIELAGMLSPPDDFDGDGLPNFQDADSDNDNIGDLHELDADTDIDGLKDRFDLDTDEDGLLDIDEAGDTDIATVPIDSDMDGAFDFRDVDSDNDGLGDGDEVNMYMSNPRSADSDGDGTSDLIEVAAGTNPNDATDNPQALGDFVFVVPFEEDPMPPRDTLSFRTNLAFVDIYFLFDISGSMSGEINALANAVGTVIGDLVCTDTGNACGVDMDCAGFGSGAEVCSPFTNTCIENPGMSSCVLSPWTGTGYYEVNLWHNDGSHGVRLQPDPMVTSAAINRSTFGGTERLYQAMQGLATPTMLDTTGGFTTVGCETLAAGEVGCPAFREHAVKIIVAFTDEDSDTQTSATNAANAMMSQNIRMVGVSSGGTSSFNALSALATASGSLDSAGSPLVYEGSDAAVVPAVVNAINEIVEGVPIEVTIDAADLPGDDGDSIPFIQELVTNTTGTNCTMLPTADTHPAGDGIDDTYPAVTPGLPVCFDIVARRNDCTATPTAGPCVMPTMMPQVFQAQLTVYGDGSPVDQRRVFFLVPPEIRGPGGPD
ncbi:MAG: hypothetical protein AB7S26_14330 [Sandaracinaceae bacterium]